MTKREKRLKKIKQNPKTVTKLELQAVLLDYGFVARSGKGSHTVYSHSKLEHPVIVVAHKIHVPSYIVKQALDAIAMVEQDSEMTEDNDDE